MIGSRKRTALYHGQIMTQHVECNPRRIIKTIAPNCITLVVLLINWVMMHGPTNIKFIETVVSRIAVWKIAMSRGDFLLKIALSNYDLLLKHKQTRTHVRIGKWQKILCVYINQEIIYVTAGLSICIGYSFLLFVVEWTVRRIRREV